MPQVPFAGPPAVSLATRTLQVDEPAFDVGRTFAHQNLGPFDPTAVHTDHAFTKVHHDPEGRVVRHTLRAADGRVEVECDGEAGSDPLAHWERVLPPKDGLHAFAADHPALRRLLKAYPALRIVAVPWMFDVAAGVVLQQKVRWREAASQFRRIAERWGRRTDLGLAFPEARRIAELGPDRLQGLGIDHKRAETLVRLARAQAQRAFLDPATDRDALRARLLRIPGIGPWTAEMIAGFGAGDPDAVPVGDLGLPGLVGGALADEPGADDARMLELLEPYRGQRFRVVRLLWSVPFGAAARFRKGLG